MRLRATTADGHVTEQVSYSIGGGFIVHEVADDGIAASVPPGVVTLPCPVESAADLLHWCGDDRTISDVVRSNERAWRSDPEIDAALLGLRDAMQITFSG